MSDVLWFVSQVPWDAPWDAAFHCELTSVDPTWTNPYLHFIPLAALTLFFAARNFETISSDPY